MLPGNLHEPREGEFHFSVLVISSHSTLDLGLYAMFVPLLSSVRNGNSVVYQLGFLTKDMSFVPQILLILASESLL